MAISRTRTAGTKLTEDEYKQIERLAQARGLTVGEWCRQVMLAHLNRPSAPVPEETILAEVLGLRMIVINLLNPLGNGERLNQEKVEAVIRRADLEKLPLALERLQDTGNR